MATELITPLGTITLEIDAQRASFELTRLRPVEHICPDIAGRFMLEVEFEPDRKRHMICCKLLPSEPVRQYPEPGERFECQSYYSEDEKTKVSIGIEADELYWHDENGALQRDSEYDYDGFFEKLNDAFRSGFELFDFTRTSHYVFGVSWIFNCDDERDTQTWYGADPTLMKKKNCERDLNR